MLGCKTMAAFAICPPPAPSTSAADKRREVSKVAALATDKRREEQSNVAASTADMRRENQSKVEAGLGVIGTADGQLDRSGVSCAAAAPSPEGVAPEGVPEGGGGGGEGRVSAGAAAAALERQGAAGKERAEEAGSGRLLLPVDDDVDSFVDFLCQKVKASA